MRIGDTVKSVPTLEDLEDETYCEVDGSCFRCRVGPNYGRNKKKDASGTSLLSVYAIDVFQTPTKFEHCMSKMDMPEDIPDLVRSETNLFVPKLLVVNFLLPAYAPPNPIWGKAKDNGESYSLVVYYSITQDVYDSMVKGETNAHTLLRRWLQVDCTNKEDYALRGRLKAIPTLLNPGDCSLGLLSSMVSMYNSKPFLTGPKYHNFYKGNDYLEVDVDIHKYVYVARSTFHGLVGEISKMMLYFGLVIEGKDDDELPETVLGGVQICRFKLTTAKRLFD